MIGVAMHHIVRHHIHNVKYLERNRMYWTMALKTFAISLVGVFVPAYLYKLGYSLHQIILYFLIREIIELVMVIPSTLSMKVIGIKRTFMIGCVVTLANLLLLYALPMHHGLFALAAVSEGLAISLFFLPYHFMFSAAVTRKDSGKQVGLMDIILSIVTALGPLVGGLLASATSVQVVLLMAVFFVAVSFGPLLHGSKPDYLKKFSYTKPFSLLLSRDSLSNMGFGVTEMIATIIWPLFIFLAVKSYATLGVIVSVSLIIIIILDYVVGYLTDKGSLAKLLRVGSITSAAVHTIRVVGTSVLGVTAINIASDVTHTLFRVPWTREFYRHAGKDRGTYIAAMELAVCVGRAVLWLLLLVASSHLSQYSFMLTAFVLGALGSLLIPAIIKK
jgi:hypothetical protein